MSTLGKIAKIGLPLAALATLPFGGPLALIPGALGALGGAAGAAGTAAGSGTLGAALANGIMTGVPQAVNAATAAAATGVLAGPQGPAPNQTITAQRGPGQGAGQPGAAPFATGLPGAPGMMGGIPMGLLPMLLGAGPRRF